MSGRINAVELLKQFWRGLTAGFMGKTGRNGPQLGVRAGLNLLTPGGAKTIADDYLRSAFSVNGFFSNELTPLATRIGRMTGAGIGLVGTAYAESKALGMVGGWLGGTVGGMIGGRRGEEIGRSVLGHGAAAVPVLNLGLAARRIGLVGYRMASAVDAGWGAVRSRRTLYPSTPSYLKSPAYLHAPIRQPNAAAAGAANAAAGATS